MVKNVRYDDAVYIDSETCGLHSMPVLLQFAEGDGPISLYDIWLEPVWKTMQLIEGWMDKTLVFFNAGFDFYQLAKLYTIWRLLPKDWIPVDHINEIAEREMDGRDGPAIKPRGCVDLMLHARKGQYQSLMARKDIRIRKVPTALAYALAEELEKRVELDGIYFAKKADPEAPRWQVFDREKDGEIDTDFKDVVLRFAPAGGLKYLAEFALGYQPKYHYEDVEAPKDWYPIELGYAPFAKAISSADKNWEVWGENKKGEPVLKGYAWPGVIKKFIDHWANRKDAREYAYDDIVYTRGLDDHFGYPEANDDDSVLACMVPVIRWHGYEIDREQITKLRDEAQAKVDASPVNINKPSEVRAYLERLMDDTEKIIIEESTQKANIEAIRDWDVDEEEADEECTKCWGEGCERCASTGTMRLWLNVAKSEEHGSHPVAAAAHEILEIKIAAKEVEMFNKLLLAGRFHADFIVIGTKSTRMSGTSGLNAQGIKGTKPVRRCFPLAWDNMVLCGGDFDSFEVTLADAVYNDPALREQLLTKIPCPYCEDGSCDECDANGEVRVKIHGLFGQSLSGLTYVEVLKSAGTNNDWYLKGKSGVFAMIYGGDASTLVRNLGVRERVANEAFEDFGKRFPGVKRARDKTFDDFCSMRQPGGPGTAVIWKEPKRQVTSFLGFSRSFELEHQICRALFELAQAVPQEWKKCPVKVWRRDRVQTAGGAVSSALYGSAFGLQSANSRAAANHEVQSPGGQITKHVQRRVWEIQPVGVHPLVVAPMNVHDELMCVTNPAYAGRVTQAVTEAVEHYRPQVPLIGMTWFEAMDNWAEKKGGAEPVKIRAEEMM